MGKTTEKVIKATVEKQADKIPEKIRKTN